MQTVDETPDVIGEKPETIHLYVVREEIPRPSPFPIILSVLALSILVVVGVAFPYRQPEERLTIRIPAVFLPLQVFTTSVTIVPTGIKTYPATHAHGTLTLTNGSVIEATLPKGILFTGTDGIEVVTDTSVFIPAGSAVGYGVASVSAHTLVSGKAGNIPQYDINKVEGSSIYIRNLTAFTGGNNSYSVKVETPQDRQTALDSARATLASQVAKIQAYLAIPCNETTQEKKGMLGLSWTCQFVTYSVPSYMKVTHVRLVGKHLFVDVVFVPRQRIFTVK